MKWNSKDGYFRYQTALRSFESLLGLGAIDWDITCELAPYATQILEYLNRQLIPQDTLKSRVMEVIDMWNEGRDDIVFDRCQNLLYKMNIDDGDYYLDDEEIPYRQDRFVLCWTNMMTALIVRLKFQYQQIFQEPELDCHLCGQISESDFSKFTYPDLDVELGLPNGDMGWRTGLSDDTPECTKNMRR